MEYNRRNEWHTCAAEESKTSRNGFDGSSQCHIGGDEQKSNYKVPARGDFIGLLIPQQHAHHSAEIEYVNGHRQDTTHRHAQCSEHHIKMLSKVILQQVATHILEEQKKSE